MIRDMFTICQTHYLGESSSLLMLSDCRSPFAFKITEETHRLQPQVFARSSSTTC